MEDRKKLLKLIAAFAAVYIIWGSTYLAIKFAIETLPPFLMAGIRFLIAGGILFTYAKYRSPSPIEPVHWKSSFIVGAFLLLGGNGFVVWAEQFVPSGFTAVLIATEPIWIVVISMIGKSGTNPSLKTVAGVLLGFAGLVFLINPFSMNEESFNYFGIAAVLLAALSWASGTIYTTRAVLPKSKLIAVAMQMLSGGVLLTLAGLILGEAGEINFDAITIKSLLAVIYLICFGSIIAFTSYIWLIEAAGPSRASTYAYVNPVVAVFLGWLLGGEVITLRIIIATVIIIISVAIINSDFSFLKRKKTSSSS